MSGSRRVLLDCMPELLSGACPVCKERWAADPEMHCSCTRPRPGDAEAMGAAYQLSASVRTAQLAAIRPQQETGVAAGDYPRPVLVAMAGRR